MSAGSPHDPAQARKDAERRRRIAEVFGDVLPDTTSDEREAGAPSSERDAGEEWLKQQVPPHHG